MVVDQHQAPGDQVPADATGRIGHHEHPGPHPASDPDRERDCVRSDTLVIVEAARLHQDERSAEPPRHETARVARHSGPWKPGELREGHLDGILQTIHEIPQPRAEDHVSGGGLPDPLRQELPGLLRFPGHTMAPAMAAVMKAAIDPPTMALSPRRERSFRRFGAIPPIPPICMAMEEKFAKPESA